MFEPGHFSAEWKGLVSYEDALLLQRDCAKQVAFGERSDHVLGLEHPHVITLGKRSKLDPIIPEGPIVWTERGGEATLHSEGQLVIYPIVKLRPRFEVRSWVEFLLRVTECSLARIGIHTERGGQSGLWTSHGKIAFLGIRIQNGVSQHGLSINVTNDLNLFSSIKACGVQHASMDSVRQRSLEMTTEELFTIWLQEYRHA